MSIIRIKDLAESVDLDREAMIAIAGGARMRTSRAYSYSASSTVGDFRLFSYSAGLAGKPLNEGQRWSPASKPAK